jgi:hypothetical protein
MGYNRMNGKRTHLRTVLAPTQSRIRLEEGPYAALPMDCQHARIRLVRVVRAREVDGVVARAGAALEGVVLDDTVEPVVVPQPGVRLTVAVWALGDVDGRCNDEGSC